MTYLLDTNACIELLNARGGHIAKKLASVSPREIRLCSIVKAKLFHGAYKSGREKNLNLVRVFLHLLKAFLSMIPLPKPMAVATCS
jgi:tRNA(fMet)-specific endonuclease VapC